MDTSSVPRTAISTEEISYRKYLPVHGTHMAYVEVGNGNPIVFLHGNPTPSYLWRNIIPHLLPLGRCLAPDYVGMGNSGAAPDGRYRFVDQQRYLDAWFDSLGLDRNVILIVHDWGSALGFAWAHSPEDVVRIIEAYSQWLAASSIPKLFIDAEPAGFLIGAQRDFCRTWPNQQTVTVRGAHFLQEDAPDAVGEAAERFVAKVLAGQISGAMT